MKADLDENGVLVILAESAVESFALTHWHTLWEKGDAVLLVSTIERAPSGAHMNTGLSPVEHR